MTLKATMSSGQDCVVGSGSCNDSGSGSGSGSGQGNDFAFPAAGVPMDTTNVPAGKPWLIRIRSGNFVLPIKSTAPSLLPAKLVWLQVRTLLGCCCTAYNPRAVGSAQSSVALSTVTITVIQTTVCYPAHSSHNSVEEHTPTDESGCRSRCWPRQMEN